MFTEVCTSTISRLVVSIVDFKRPSTSYVRHLSHRSMNEPEKHLSAVFSIYAINELKDGLGGWKIVSVSVSKHTVCFAHKLERIIQDAIRITQ